MAGLFRKIGNGWGRNTEVIRLDPEPPVTNLAADPDARLYTPATTPPYNAPVPLVTPTYDESGEAIHPKVLDFGTSGWRGWRYWMAMTPFTGGNDRTENPSILVSQNGYYWQVPDGLVNPVYPAPPVPGFGSDTHLEYDPAADQLVLLFRETLDRSAHTVRIARSSDGITWPVSSTDTALVYPDTDLQTISPVILRVADGDWRMFGLSYLSKALDMWTAPTAEGPWAGPFRTVGIGISGPTWNWHLEVEYIDGVFRALIDRGPLHEGRPDGYRASSSLDGLTWSTSSSDFMTKGPTEAWDGGQHYRACMLPDEAGTHYRIWYSGHDSSTVRVWGIGYSEVPRSAWPAPQPLPEAGTGNGYRDLALSHSPALLWRMGNDPTISAVGADQSINGRNGDWEGRFVRGSSLSGDQGYSNRIDQGRLWRASEPWMAMSDYTISLIYKPETTFSAMSLVSLSGSNGGWNFRTNGSQLQFVHLSSGTIITTTGTVSAPNTYHLAVSVTAAGAVTIYRNGVQVGSGTIPTDLNITGARLAAGGRWGGSSWIEYSRGFMEYVAVTPSILSAAQIAALSTEALA